MKKKALPLVAAMTLLVSGVLSGCGGGQTSGGPTPSADAGENVTVKFMHLWPAGSSKQHNMIVSNIVEEYQTANPNVKIDLEVLSNDQYKEKIKVLASSNQLPDIGLTWAAGYLQPYVEGNKFATLDDVLDGGLRDSFVSGTTEAYAVDGKTYGLPLELNIAPIYYNKEIFKKYNLEVPKTFDEFKTVVKTLADNGIAPITVGNKEPWTGSMWYMYLADRIGGPEALTNAINRTSSFEDPALIQAAAEIQNLVDLNAFVKGYNGLSNEEAKGPFMNGQAGMYMMGTWELPNYTTNEDVPKEFKDSIGFFKFPTVEGGKGDSNSFVGGPGVGLFVSENSKVKEQAKDFAAFFVQKWGERSVTDAGVIPATKVDTSKLDLPQMYIDVLNELSNASNITLYADVQMSAAVAQVHLNMIQSLYGKQISPEEFAKKQEEALSNDK
ncbi:extracellular solute-binding protein [Ammoniphilus sp. YIM 78166]|uniref:extracellular solute-binding protein n=1 Tax=Ammoniphilus sp. YIM 78166 TaxID=1644106 RepID=UPI001F109BF1|nr:extracellular solute-binding protein [Ammoniphilus sp. YIM 78166]